MRGYTPGRFSFNVHGGRCEDCQGAGVRRIEMHFLADVFVECETCRGMRFNSETLRVTFRELSIAQVLDLTVRQAMEVFERIPMIYRVLKVMDDVGLGYIKLGQPAPTLSGGEAQRVKLAKELARPGSTHTMYILDEPTTGLHFHDVRKLLHVLDRLVTAGNTVVVIEHNLDVVKNADWIIDLGPEGGDGGGLVIAEGTPEDVAGVPESYTGRFLAELLAEA
jgi:excinuclease ABC subunit A